jgi:phospholipid/cholesterol/gamma-HCH transport system substrate-binding protein
MRRIVALACGTAVLAASGCAIQPNDHTLPGQTAVGGDGYTVTVHFDQIENLVPNSTVLQDNVVIGTVASIDTKNWEAVVELRLLRDIPLPTDATFSIGQKTLLGAQYVDVVVPPKHDRTTLSDGAVVPVDQTGTYPPTEQVLGAVALLLNNGGLSQISTITGQLSTALHGRVPDMRGLLRHANDLLSVLDSNRDRIVAAIQSLDHLSAGLRGDQTPLVGAIDRIAPGLQVLEQERTRLVRALSNTALTSDRAVRVVHASRTALLANLDALGPILTNLGRASQALPEALKLGLTIPFPVMTTRNAIKGDYTNLFTTFDLRGSGLADAWLSGLPPALQAGDPIRVPLSPTGDGHGGNGLTGGLGDGVNDLLDQLPVDDGVKDLLDQLSLSSDQDTCVLSALGLC